MGYIHHLFPRYPGSSRANSSEDGVYMFHCHNLVHEDHDMMAAFNVSVLEDFGYPETTRFIDPMEERWRAKSYAGTDLTTIKDETLPFFSSLDAYAHVDEVQEVLIEYHLTHIPGQTKTSSTTSSTSSTASSYSTTASPTPTPTTITTTTPTTTTPTTTRISTTTSSSSQTSSTRRNKKSTTSKRRNKKSTSTRRAPTKTPRGNRKTRRAAIPTA
jgi:bilirubin oxidase